MDIQQLMFFSKIAELQNISKAADVLYTTQPTLSRVVKKLEDELECELFSHRGKSIYLTDSGRVLQRRSREILRILGDTKEEIAALQGVAKEEVTIHLRCISGLFFDIFNDFLLTNEDLCFHIIQNDNQGIHLADYDLLFIPTTEPMSTSSSQTVLKEEIFIAVSSHSALASKPVLYPSDLDGSQYVSIASNRYFYQITTNHREQMGNTSSCQIFCDDAVAVRNMVRDGNFISHIPQFTWSQEDLHGVVLKRVEGFPLYRYVSMNWKPDAYRGPMVKKFQSYIWRALRERGYLYTDDN